MRQFCPRQGRLASLCWTLCLSTAIRRPRGAGITAWSPPREVAGCNKSDTVRIRNRRPLPPRTRTRKSPSRASRHRPRRCCRAPAHHSHGARPAAQTPGVPAAGESAPDGRRTGPGPGRSGQRETALGPQDWDRAAPSGPPHRRLSKWQGRLRRSTGGAGPLPTCGHLGRVGTSRLGLSGAARGASGGNRTGR